MYNIVKTCKAEILPYFNEVFDAMAKVRATLDRLRTLGLNGMANILFVA